jgi:hypothetical protein
MTNLAMIPIDPESLRRKLESIRDKTASAERLSASGWWARDGAGERRCMDDLRFGRTFWRGALDNARAGLLALELGDLKAAELRAWEATALYIAALERRLRPSDHKDLARSAKPRGRPPGAKTQKKGKIRRNS